MTRFARLGRVVTFASVAAATLGVVTMLAMTRARPVAERAPRGFPDLSREHRFDSIDLSNYARFWKDWQLVTVRYRKDNSEQRFIYANAIAWAAMRRGDSIYPDGAMFGKIAFHSEDDPSFPNSVQPRAFTRLQLMRKDSKLYKESNGWGYAIVVGGQRPPYDSAAAIATACHACHRLVPERDFVFSKATFLGATLTPSPAEAAAFKRRFVRKNVAALTAFQRQALSRLPPRRGMDAISTIYSLDMDLFDGSLNESVGVLSGFATVDSSVFAMWDEPHRRYVIAEPLPPASGCEPRVAVAMTTRPPGGVARPGRPEITRVAVTCGGNWVR